jgi:hypothetical protein
MPRSAPPSEAVTGLDDHRIDRGRALALVWAGMVLGVSFLATPAKFLATSLSRPVALDVGRHTFRTFGRAEVALAALLGLRVAASSARQRPLALAPGLIVLAQALWLRPRLDARTRQVVEGKVPPPPSGLHLAYVACDAAKLAALLTLGLTATRSRMRSGR